VQAYHSLLLSEQSFQCAAAAPTLYGAEAEVTLTADGPFWPSWISNSTASFSAKVLKPCFWMALKCTKTSLEPSLGEMKPKPLVSLNHLTCPLILSDILMIVGRKIAAGWKFFLFGGVVGLRMSVGSQVTLEFKQHDKKNERLIYMMDLARGWYFKGVKYCRVGTLIKEVWLVVGG